MPYTLLIVESPAKCAKIESYLGAGYKCMASFGHIRQLNGLASIDIDRQFRPTFSVSEGKTAQVAKLRKAIRAAKEVILASDDDREGEAIAWHICDVFGLPIEQTKRIKFHEITKSALQHAVAHPTVVDMDLVHAQQARQILDLLVGFQISPVLWKHVSSKQGLSAGRCQTPALRILYDNQKEVDASEGVKQYTTTGYFTKLVLPFVLDHHHTEEEAMADFLEASANHDHIFHKQASRTKTCAPPKPFSTSGLQQAASNELKLSPKQTMSLCQTLYEGGFITYMRTESTEYCEEFHEIAGKYIQATYGIDVAHEKQETELAHEAIRPTNIALEEALDGRELRLYKLIRRNTIESLMPPASVSVIQSRLSAPEGHTYKYDAERTLSPGWRIVQNKSCDERAYGLFEHLADGSTIEYKKIAAATTLTKTVAHYTEARLVKLLEQKGIGRPSTFATLVEKNIERGYVQKTNLPGKMIECVDFELTDEAELIEHTATKEFGAEKGKLVIQPTGVLVVEFLQSKFASLFDYDYTSTMEARLDEIAQGEQVWHKLCESCQQTIGELTEGLPKNHKEHYCIDKEHTYLIGKHGPVIKRTDPKGKTTFMSVKQDIDIERLKAGSYSLNELIEHQNSLGEHEGKPILLRNGKFGEYVQWGNERVNVGKLVEVTKATVVPLLGQTRTIDTYTSVRKGKYGDYIYYKTPDMKKPRFIKLDGFEGNARTCSIEELQQFRDCPEKT